MLQEKYIIFINLEKYEDALVYLDQILSINPNDVEILIRKGKSCQMLGKMEQAMECFERVDRKSTRLNSSHKPISYAVFCLKKNK